MSQDVDFEQYMRRRRTREYFAGLIVFGAIGAWMFVNAISESEPVRHGTLLRVEGVPGQLIEKRPYRGDPGHVILKILPLAPGSCEEVAFPYQLGARVRQALDHPAIYRFEVDMPDGTRCRGWSVSRAADPPLLTVATVLATRAGLQSWLHDRVVIVWWVCAAFASLLLFQELRERHLVERANAARRKRHATHRTDA